MSRFFLFFLLVNYCRGIYFHMKETEERCFLEDVPEETLLQGNYQLLVPRGNTFATSDTLRVNVRVTDPDDEVILSRVYAAEGKFAFTAHKPGEYRICISTDSSVWFGGKQLRIHLDIAIGDHAVNYQEVATKDRLNDIQLRVRQLLDQVTMIAKSQEYSRSREEIFRSLSDSTSQRVTYWSIGQLVLLACIGFWQMRHLRSFFQAKKLV